MRWARPEHLPGGWKSALVGPSGGALLETYDEEADGRIAEQEARIAAETRAEARIQELENVRTTVA